MPPTGFSTKANIDDTEATMPSKNGLAPKVIARGEIRGATRI